jgi:hypothetical protein
MGKSSIFTENNYIDTLDTPPKKEVNSADGSWVSIASCVSSFARHVRKGPAVSESKWNQDLNTVATHICIFPDFVSDCAVCFQDYGMKSSRTSYPYIDLPRQASDGGRASYGFPAVKGEGLTVWNFALDEEGRRICMNLTSMQNRAVLMNIFSPFLLRLGVRVGKWKVVPAYIEAKLQLSMQSCGCAPLARDCGPAAKSRCRRPTKHCICTAKVGRLLRSRNWTLKLCRRMPQGRWLCAEMGHTPFIPVYIWQFRREHNDQPGDFRVPWGIQCSEKHMCHAALSSSITWIGMRNWCRWARTRKRVEWCAAASRLGGCWHSQTGEDA